MNFLSLSKKDFTVIFIIFSFLLLITVLNMRVSFRKSRDQQRKGDIRAIYDALNRYNDEFSFYPGSQNGKILACKGPVNKFGYPDFVPCEWGEDSIRDIFDDSYPPYLENLPKDPQSDKGAQYLYLSTGSHFQLYAALESSNQDEYNPSIVARNLSCGNRICNFGLANGETPLDKSLQEYENELLDK
jgi:type II secretory pathway pseudopilin PulG